MSGPSQGRMPARTAPSLTDLFETDALLDALGQRRSVPVPPELRHLRLLSALADSVDTADTQLTAPVDPVFSGALAAAYAAAMSAGSGPDLSVDSPMADAVALRAVPECLAEGPRWLARSRAAGRAVLDPSAHRLVALGVGAALVLTGGGLAAAATTSPATAWGPIRPVIRALHPGWTENNNAARAAVLRRLDQASRQSEAGHALAAAATYGVAQQQARDLPSGPDATIRAKLDQVARELGLPTSAASTGPTGTTGADPSVQPPQPVSGAAPGTLPPAAPAATAPPANPPSDSSPTPGDGSPSATDPTTGPTPSASSSGASTTPSPAPGDDPTAGSGGGAAAGTGSGAGAAGSVDGSAGGSAGGSADGSADGSGAASAVAAAGTDQSGTQVATAADGADGSGADPSPAPGDGAAADTSTG
jgi:hypothetical protein